jgi:hypothetical protein
MLPMLRPACPRGHSSALWSGWVGLCQSGSACVWPSRTVSGLVSPCQSGSACVWPSRTVSGLVSPCWTSGWAGSAIPVKESEKLLTQQASVPIRWRMMSTYILFTAPVTWQGKYPRLVGGGGCGNLGQTWWDPRRRKPPRTPANWGLKSNLWNTKIPLLNPYTSRQTVLWTSFGQLF